MDNLTFFEFLKWLWFSLKLHEGGLSISWNITHPAHRHIGFRPIWYDGPLWTFAFWWWQITLYDTDTRFYHLSYAIKDMIRVSPEVHLLSSNEYVRKYAENYLKSLAKK